ncbi:unnamed protein product [Pseudo-nitzschia multistriata]|uniref:Phosphatidate cytidylyltransferase n=1 Tax=Pseudo-nitzschia multistriata TaxID=183589 RepID=A0A448ZJL2_9STRA|nr:unnamed protein product [Pseudo-nitzschia multistriata]
MLEPASTTSASTPTAPRPLSRLLFCAASLLLAAIPESSSSLYCFGSSLAAGVFCLANSHHCVVGLMVVTLPFRAWCQLALGNSDGSTFLSTVAVLLTVWNADTGALVAGRLLGRRRSTPGCLPEWIRRVSPAKTAEGFLGGILGGIATALWLVPMLVRVFSMDTTPGIRSLWGLDADDGLGAVKRITLGFVLSVLAILGDLVESSVKRLSHSKDSGSVLPGHGGILDRFDSSLLAVLFYRVVLDQATELTYGTSGDAIMESGEKEEL